MPAPVMAGDHEKEELALLRRENRRLREDAEILKHATAFFASMPS